MHVHIKIKLLKISEKEKNLEGCQRKRHIQEITIRMTADFSETMEARQQLNNKFKQLTGKEFKSEFYTQ